MPYILQICFNNSSRLSKDLYYFNYKDTKFKLIQNNPRKGSDVLISIIDTHYTPPPLNMQERIFLNASEFLSALCWENNSMVKLWGGGGNGIKQGVKLRNVKYKIFDFPKIPYNRIGREYGIRSIPYIENEEQRTALYSYR